MSLQLIIDAADEFLRDSELNRIDEKKAFKPELAGMMIYDRVYITAASAGDAIFDALKAPEALGDTFMAPREWLPEAQSVVSAFCRFSAGVRKSNARSDDWPSPEWLHGRIEGQAFLQGLSARLIEVVADAGYKGVAPMLDTRLASPGEFLSNWSERHIAYACGSGTFGLSKGLITIIGVAGRFASFVTEMELVPTGRDYEGLYDYCTNCLACARKCPAKAISRETGKDHAKCSAFLDAVRDKHAPYYGCGKCQTGVPCESGAPGLSK